MYDALLLASFGGPEGPDDVLPFLRNVTAGRDIPDERLVEVGEHYHHFGGRSPINDQNKALITALQADLAEHGIDLPIYFGNRNWDPFFADALRAMRDDGVERCLALVTSAYSSWSGCRQYREDLARARAEVGDGAPEVDKVRVYYNDPGFVDANVDAVLAALDQLPAAVRDDARIVFTTHSIPLTMSRHCDYEAQHLDACRVVVEQLEDRHGRRHRWDLTYCSRSGPPHVPWLEPDVGDHLATLAARGVPAAVVAPIGFVSDHMEVIYDLDVEAREAADEAGIAFARAATVGTHPAFVAGLRELVRERIEDGTSRATVGLRGPKDDACPVDCCLTPSAPSAVPTVASAAPLRRRPVPT